MRQPSAPGPPLSGRASIPVGVARAAFGHAVLVVEEDEPNEDGPQGEAEQAEHADPRRELQHAGLRHALCCGEVEV
eukprot:CAMPEP_0179128956 /NCGR_PEP_ID=MMETSP0796-20121207/61165_1 /TAXON_ID=73915 /ORGANISM="Pyrodinium bahamense, Strain pbaha01" /LENGTH=75 /DNA_ID=CAMNT_0020827819 /DNA_START=42 /DNA_END=266 /DNA_ORIENTATION=+